MVAFEFARDFDAQGLFLQTLCLEKSPLAEKLQTAKLPVLAIPAKGFFSKIKSFAKIIHELTPDTIICQHLHDLWYLVPVIYFKKIRVIGLSHTFLGVSKKDPLHSILYGRLDQMICLTSLHKANLIENLSMPAEKFAVIPNMVDVARFSPYKKSLYLHERYSISKNKLLLGVVGRLDQKKGQYEAIAALDLLKQYGDQIHLFIIGENTLNEPETDKQLRDLVVEKDLQNFVTFTGHINEVETAMASLDILLVPSSAETFGRTIIEGMASGVPVIATRAGGVPDIITHGQTGFLVEPGSIQDLADAIEKLMKSPALREHIRTLALAKAHNKYSREVVEEKLWAVFTAS